MSALFNGAPAADWANSRGLHYGDGVFRTMLIDAGAVLDWRLQLQKLAEDAAVLGLQPPSAALLESETQQLLQGQRRAVLKLILMRRAGGRGYRSDETASDRLLLLSAAPRYPLTHWTDGVQAFRCGLQLAAQPALAGVKHLNRLEQVLASRDWPQHADEGILCDTLGRPVCGTRSNLFWISDGALHTPAMTDCGVAGMMRQKILTLAESLQIETRVGMGRWEDLSQADEVFFSNSLIGIWPLRQLDSRRWTAPRPLTRRLVSALSHPVLS